MIEIGWTAQRQVTSFPSCLNLSVCALDRQAVEMKNVQWKRSRGVDVSLVALSCEGATQDAARRADSALLLVFIKLKDGRDEILFQPKRWSAFVL